MMRQFIDFLHDRRCRASDRWIGVSSQARRPDLELARCAELLETARSGVAEAARIVDFAHLHVRPATRLVHLVYSVVDGLAAIEELLPERDTVRTSRWTRSEYLNHLVREYSRLMTLHGRLAFGSPSELRLRHLARAADWLHMAGTGLAAAAVANQQDERMFRTSLHCKRYCLEIARRIFQWMDPTQAGELPDPRQTIQPRRLGAGAYERR